MSERPNIGDDTADELLALLQRWAACEGVRSEPDPKPDPLFANQVVRTIHWPAHTVRRGIYGIDNPFGFFRLQDRRSIKNARSAMDRFWGWALDDSGDDASAPGAGTCLSRWMCNPRINKGRGDHLMPGFSLNHAVVASIDGYQNSIPSLHAVANSAWL